METTPLRSKILDTIIRKSTLKQRIFDNTFSAFNELKETLLEMASELDDELDGKLDRRVRLEYLSLIHIYASMNTVTVENAEGTFTFSTMDADKSEANGLLLGARCV